MTFYDLDPIAVMTDSQFTVAFAVLSEIFAPRIFSLTGYSRVA